jgi:hypothetical protein
MGYLFKTSDKKSVLNELLPNEINAPGHYKIKFDASLHTSGTYFAKLIQGEKSAVQKLIYMK